MPEQIRFQNLPQASMMERCFCGRQSNILCWICGKCEYCDRVHVFCHRCYMRHFQVTSCCGRCVQCCSCVFCAGCRKGRQEALCERCHECQVCCGNECQQETPYRVEAIVAEEIQDIQFHPPKLTELITNSSSRLISVEIEVANVRDQRKVDFVVKKWGGRIVPDGSLPATGFEINTAPAGGDLFLLEIKEICKTLREERAAVTEACGLHVHVDARDYSYYDMRRLILAYASVETALFDMVIPRRRTNRYCRPCGDRFRQAITLEEMPLKSVKRAVLQSVYAIHVDKARDYRGHKWCPDRYYALNLHSWFYRGTIECRLFGGTTMVSKISLWGILWAVFLDRVKGWTDDEMKIAFLNLSPKEALLKIFEAHSMLQKFCRRRWTNCTENHEER